jgi:hypothetical protein
MTATKSPVSERPERFVQPLLAVESLGRRLDDAPFRFHREVLMTA